MCVLVDGAKFVYSRDNAALTYFSEPMAGVSGQLLEHQPAASQPARLYGITSVMLADLQHGSHLPAPAGGITAN